MTDNRYDPARFDKPPDGHTPAGRPYWEFTKKGKGGKRDLIRLFGPWPSYPGVEAVTAGDDPEAFPGAVEDDEDA